MVKNNIIMFQDIGQAIRSKTNGKWPLKYTGEAINSGFQDTQDTNVVFADNAARYW